MLEDTRLSPKLIPSPKLQHHHQNTEKLRNNVENNPHLTPNVRPQRKTEQQQLPVPATTDQSGFSISVFNQNGGGYNINNVPNNNKNELPVNVKNVRFPNFASQFDNNPNNANSQRTYHGTFVGGRRSQGLSDQQQPLPVQKRGQRRPLLKHQIVNKQLTNVNKQQQQQPLRRRPKPRVRKRLLKRRRGRYPAIS